MESLFCQRDDFEAEAIETEPAFGQDGSWSNAQFVEEYVDAMLCRSAMLLAFSPCLLTKQKIQQKTCFESLGDL